MISASFTRRSFAARLASMFSVIGVTDAVSSETAAAQTPTSQSLGVQKLTYDGRPADGTQMITPLIVHNGLIYISGQGANDAGAVQGADIGDHTTKVMNNVKQLVEAGGGTMDSILQLTVYLASLEHYDAMNRVFKTYFPRGGPARTTVSVAGVPGRSLLEINCIAAVTRR